MLYLNRQINNCVILTSMLQRHLLSVEKDINLQNISLPASSIFPFWKV